MDNIKTIEIRSLWTEMIRGSSCDEVELTVYPILARYSTISGIANRGRRLPAALEASMVAAFDCTEFRCSIASLYVLVDIVRDRGGVRHRADRMRREITREGNQVDILGARRRHGVTQRAEA